MASFTFFVGFVADGVFLLDFFFFPSVFVKVFVADGFFFFLLGFVFFLLSSSRGKGTIFKKMQKGIQVLLSITPSPRLLLFSGGQEVYFREEQNWRVLAGEDDPLTSPGYLLKCRRQNLCLTERKSILQHQLLPACFPLLFLKLICYCALFCFM